MNNNAKRRDFEWELEKYKSKDKIAFLELVASYKIQNLNLTFWNTFHVTLLLQCFFSNWYALKAKYTRHSGLLNATQQWPKRQAHSQASAKNQFQYKHFLNKNSRFPCGSCDTIIGNINSWLSSNCNNNWVLLESGLGRWWADHCVLNLYVIQSCPWLWCFS